MAGGIDWFRWHHGSVTDQKFPLVAKRAGASVAEVIAVWACLLEAASMNAERGCIGTEPDFEAMDCALGMADGRAQAIFEAIRARELVDEHMQISAWPKRQPRRERDDDSSTDRVKAFRDRKRQETPGNAGQAQATPREAEERSETPRGEESREEKKKSPPGGGDRPGAALIALRPASPPAFDGENESEIHTKAVVPISDGWQLPESWGIDAEALGWKQSAVLIEAEKFRQYWTKGKGSGTRRSLKGWRQSWSNWLGKAAERMARA